MTSIQMAWTITQKPIDYALHKISCEVCSQMINGIEKHLMPLDNNNEIKYIYSNSLLDQEIGYEFNDNNLKIVHEIHIQLSEGEDFFSKFDILFKKHFQHTNSIRNAIQLQIFERLYLRAITILTSFNINFNKVELFEISATNLRQYKLELGFVSTTSSNEVNYDLPISTDYIVKSSNINFDKFVKLSYIYFNCKLNLNSLQKQIILKYLTGKIRMMYEITKNSPDFIKNRRNVAYNYLTYLEDRLKSDFAAIDSQRIQLFELCGKSGVGKSRAVQNLQHIIMALVRLIPKQDIVYTRANDYWWNGYCGQPIILYDDLTHIKKKLKFDLAFELIAVASGTFRNPPMAFDKDMPFTSVVGFITSNIPILTTVADKETLIALKRRIISKPWIPLEIVKCTDKDTYEYQYTGFLINVIWNTENQSMFSVFSIVLDIIHHEQNFTLHFNDNINIVYDEHPSSISTQSSTSSVSKSTGRPFNLKNVFSTDEECEMFEKEKDKILNICLTKILNNSDSDITVPSKEETDNQAYSILNYFNNFIYSDKKKE
jgi:hypothetical protein